MHSCLSASATKAVCSPAHNTFATNMFERHLKVKKGAMNFTLDENTLDSLCSLGLPGHVSFTRFTFDIALLIFKMYLFLAL